MRGSHTFIRTQEQRRWRSATHRSSHGLSLTRCVAFSLDRSPGCPALPPVSLPPEQAVSPLLRGEQGACGLQSLVRRGPSAAPLSATLTQTAKLALTENARARGPLRNAERSRPRSPRDRTTHVASLENSAKPLSSKTRETSSDTQEDSPGDNAAEKRPAPQPRGLPESEATHNRYLFAGEGNLIFTTTWRFCHKLPTKGKAKTEKHPPWGCHAGLS